VRCYQVLPQLLCSLLRWARLSCCSQANQGSRRLHRVIWTSMSASYVYEGGNYDLEAAIAAVAADMHLDDWDDGLTGNWPDMERGLRTFDSEEDEAPEQGDLRNAKAMTLTKHLQALVQFTTHKCCLAGKMPEGVRARNRASCHRCQQARPVSDPGAAGTCAVGRCQHLGCRTSRHGGRTTASWTPDGVTISGLPLWNERLISQLMLGIATRGVHKTARPVPAVAELHALVK
jgi:hypothetical protein